MGLMACGEHGAAEFGISKRRAATSHEYIIGAAAATPFSTGQGYGLAGQHDIR